MPIVFALIATAIYALATYWLKFPLLADDFIFLVKAHSPDFQLQDFAGLLTQRPLSSLLNFLALKHHFFEQTWLLYFYFFLHSLGLMRIVIWLRGSHKSFILLCFYPCFFEVLFMRLNLPYCLGTLLLSYALTSSNSIKRIVLMWLAFCSLETYVLPAFILPLLPTILSQRRSNTLRYTLEWLLALSAYLLTRNALLIPGSPILAWRFSDMLLTQYISLLFTLHFYKIYWIETGLFWAAIGILLIQANRRTRLAFFILPVAASLHTIMMDYYAPRAIHGAGIILLALLAHALSVSKKPLVPIALLCTAFSLQLGIIFHTRFMNDKILQNLDTQWATTMRSCQEPCILPIHNLHHDFLRDWIMPPYAWTPFLQWVQLHNGIQKHIEFR